MWQPGPLTQVCVGHVYCARLPPSLPIIFLVQKCKSLCHQFAGGQGCTSRSSTCSDWAAPELGIVGTTMPTGGGGKLLLVEDIDMAPPQLAVLAPPPTHSTFSKWISLPGGGGSQVPAGGGCRHCASAGARGAGAAAGEPHSAPEPPRTVDTRRARLPVPGDRYFCPRCGLKFLGNPLSSLDLKTAESALCRLNCVAVQCKASRQEPQATPVLACRIPCIISSTQARCPGAVLSAAVRRQHHPRHGPE